MSKIITEFVLCENSVRTKSSSKILIVQMITKIIYEIIITSRGTKLVQIPPLPPPPPHSPMPGIYPNF